MIRVRNYIRARVLISFTYDRRRPIIRVVEIIGFLIQESGYGRQTRQMDLGADPFRHRQRESHRGRGGHLCLHDRFHVSVRRLKENIASFYNMCIRKIEKSVTESFFFLFFFLFFRCTDQQYIKSYGVQRSRQFLTRIHPRKVYGVFVHKTRRRIRCYFVSCQTKHDKVLIMYSVHSEIFK